MSSRRRSVSKLGRYDIELQRRLEKHPIGNNTQFYGNAALNVKLLSTRTPAPRGVDVQ